MQSVASAFTAEEKDKVRSVIGDLLISWKKHSTLGNRTFTIGVSTVGGGDIIGINPGAIGHPGIWQYFDESNYVTHLAWERGLNMPIGGLSKALAEAELDNTSGRFTPRYMGGSSELFTSILPRRPMIINAGFNYDGVDSTIPQFAGIVTEQPNLDLRNKLLRLKATDYVDFFQNRYLDQTVMFTGLRTDQVLESLFSQLGMATSQYELDAGINVIPFGVFEKGKVFDNTINELVQAENGHLYQDEEGKFRFENRQHWDSSPHNSVQRVVLTGQVINAEAPNLDHIVNVVEIRARVRRKQPEQIIFRLNTFDSILIAGNSTEEVFVNFSDPILSMTTPTHSGADSFFVAYSEEDGSGTELTSNLSVVRVTLFAEAAKLEIRNSSAGSAYLTQLVISGRPAKVEREIYLRDQDDSSVTAFEERKVIIENDFIQDEVWAETLGKMILNDYSEPENLQRITIRAMPTLQLGDLISWQGRYWRIFNIRAMLNPNVGFVQELTLLQRDITSYFRIGISTIGGSDKIAP